MALERDYQAGLIRRLKNLFPGIVIQKLDSGYQQGIPDLLLLYKIHWAILETKKSLKDRLNPEPNQEYFVDLFNSMSYSSFIYPENEESVLHDLQQIFKPGRDARLPRR